MSTKKIYGYKAFFRDEQGLYTQPAICNGRFYFNEDEPTEFFGKLELCQNGLHFCRQLKDIPKYFPVLPITEVWKIEIIGDVIDDTKKEKSATNKLKLVKKIDDNIVYKIYKINNSLISESNNTVKSLKVFRGNFVDNSSNIVNSEHIQDSNTVLLSNHTNIAYNILVSSYIDSANNIYQSSYIYNSDMIEHSNNIYKSQHIFKSNNIENSIAITKCRHLQYSIFCYEKQFKQFLFFNKKITNKRYSEVRETIRHIVDKSYNSFALKFKPNDIFRPDFLHNFKICKNEKKEWDMSIKDIKKIMSFKEFNKNIFKKITGIDVDKLKI